MKKNILLIAICTILSIFSIKTSAQVVGIYKNAYVNENYSVRLSNSPNGLYTLWIGCTANSGNNIEKGGIMLNDRIHLKFIDALQEAKSTYEKMREDAIARKVTKMNKPVRIFCETGGYFVYNDRYIVNLSSLDFLFKVETVDGISSYIMFINTGQMVWQENNSVKSDGFNLAFTSTDEIDQFIKLVSIENIKRLRIEKDSVSQAAKLKKETTRKKTIAKNPFLAHFSYGLKGAYQMSLGMNDINPGIVGPYLLSDNLTMNISGGISAGLFARTVFKRFIIQPEIVYNTGISKSSFTFYDDHIQSVKFAKNLYISMIDIPLLFGYRFIEKSNFSLQVLAGPKLRLDAGSSVKYMFYSTYGNNTQSDIKTPVEKSKIGLETGLEIDYHNFVFGARYNLIEDMSHSTLNNNVIDKMNANSLVLSFGIKLFNGERK